jgi:hypothetical protein
MLARLPFIHTCGVLSLWIFFGKTWLLFHHPDVAVAIVSVLMIYAIFRYVPCMCVCVCVCVDVAVAIVSVLMIYGIFRYVPCMCVCVCVC